MPNAPVVLQIERLPSKSKTVLMDSDREATAPLWERALGTT
jgi:hypothetical protein